MPTFLVPVTATFTGAITVEADDATAAAELAAQSAEDTLKWVTVSADDTFLNYKRNSVEVHKDGIDRQDTGPKALTPDTPVTLWWTAHDEAELAQYKAEAEAVGATDVRVEQRTTPPLYYDITFTTTVGKAIGALREDAASLVDCYFDTDEYPNALAEALAMEQQTSY